MMEIKFKKGNFEAAVIEGLRRLRGTGQDISRNMERGGINFQTR
jgi:hypothetical protein